MPWSMNDGPIGWVEVTDHCNLRCRGCYRAPAEGHKPLAQIKREIDLLKRWRNSDNISLAGGEPLTHPDLCEIVAYVREQGLKPLIFSNGLRLLQDPHLARELKRAGLMGYTLHVDSEQGRPDGKGRDELGLCEVRLELARRVAEAGRTYLCFGATVYRSNLEQVPSLVRWAADHIDLVHGLVFITYRGVPADLPFDYHCAGRSATVEGTEPSEELSITACDVAERIRQGSPGFRPAAYLGGTLSPEAIKWLIGVQLGTRGEIHGALGARAIELVQVLHHLWRGRYLAYAAVSRVSKALFLLAGPDPRGIGRALGGYVRAILRRPSRALVPLYAQTVVIIQPPDLLPDGRIEMCEGCPEMSWWKGKLVHTCRLDEWRQFGGYVSPQPTR